MEKIMLGGIALNRDACQHWIGRVMLYKKYRNGITGFNAVGWPLFAAANLFLHNWSWLAFDVLFGLGTTFFLWHSWTSLIEGARRNKTEAAQQAKHWEIGLAKYRAHKSRGFE